MSDNEYTLDDYGEDGIERVRGLITGAIIMSAVQTTDEFIQQFEGKIFNPTSNIVFNVGIMLRGEDIIHALEKTED